MYQSLLLNITKSIDNKMMGKTHLAFGLLFAIVSFIFLPIAGYEISNTFLFFAVVLFCSLLSDIDEPESKLGRKFPPSILIKLTLGHRGFFHTIWVGLILSILFYYFGLIYSIAALIGYCSHLIGDSLTISGVNWLYPFKGNIKGFIRTGGFLEKIIFIIICSLNAWLMWKLFI